jgi:hypothetical protein
MAWQPPAVCGEASTAGSAHTPRRMPTQLQTDRRLYGRAGEPRKRLTGDKLSPHPVQATVKLSPQPHAPVALGLWNTKLAFKP